MNILKTIYVPTEELSEKVQQKLFKEGLRWNGDMPGSTKVFKIPSEYLNIWSDNTITHSHSWGEDKGLWLDAREYLMDIKKENLPEGVDKYAVVGNLVKLEDSSDLFFIANSENNIKILVSLDGKEGRDFECYKKKIIVVYKIRLLSFVEDTLSGLVKVWEKEWDTITENELYKLYGGYVKVVPNKDKEF